MRKACIACIWMLLICFAASGQKGPEYTLIGEGNVITVKLLWYPNVWPKDVEGFNIKRRIVTSGRPGKWDAVNSTPIIVEITTAKDLSNVEPDRNERQRLKDKLQEMLKAGNIKEVPHQQFINRLTTDTYGLASLIFTFALDYDLALLNGFGLVDRGLPAAEQYEYGLFPYLKNKKEAAKPVATYRWTYGEKPDLDVITNFYYEPVADGKRVQLKWSASAPQLTEKHILGYNLYRKEKGQKDWQKLTTNPVWMGRQGDSASAEMFDNITPDKVYEYRVAPVSAFGTEGPFTALTYDPADIPGDITPPELQLKPVPAEMKGVHFTWMFTKEQEKDLKGFILQRRMHADSPQRAVSAMLPPAARTWSDMQGLQPDNYYFYRIAAIRRDNTPFYSNEMILYYKPLIRPPAPTGLRGVWRKEGEQNFIELSWDAAARGDTLTAGYNLYASFPPDTTLLSLDNIPLIKGNSYRYPISHPWSREHYFAITAESGEGDESHLSNKAMVVTPTTEMPLISIWPFQVDSNRITLEWEYKELPDLKGFRLYQDDKLIADENTLRADSRKWVSPAMPYNTTFRYTIEAVNRTGAGSRRSKVLNVHVDRKKK